MQPFQRDYESGKHIILLFPNNLMYIFRQLFLVRKVRTNLASVLESKDIALLTKVCIVKAVVFPVVM